MNVSKIIVVTCNYIVGEVVCSRNRYFFTESICVGGVFGNSNRKKATRHRKVPFKKKNILTQKSKQILTQQKLNKNIYCTHCKLTFGFNCRSRTCQYYIRHLAWGIQNLPNRFLQLHPKFNLHSFQ